MNEENPFPNSGEYKRNVDNIKKAVMDKRPDLKEGDFIIRVEEFAPTGGSFSEFTFKVTVGTKVIMSGTCEGEQVNFS